MALMRFQRNKKIKGMASGVLLLAATVAIASSSYSVAESKTGKWDSLLRGILNEALQGQQAPTETTEKETETEANDATSVEAEATNANETAETVEEKAEETVEETSTTATTQEKPENYDALKIENEQLQRQIGVLRDMKFQETMRRIEGLNVRKGAVERNITFLESEKTELAKHIDYLEKQLAAYQGKTEATETSEAKDETPAQN